MPITALRCPNCLLPQPFDHFEGTACGDRIHPDYIAAVLADRVGKADRVGRIGVSDALSCPRRKVLSETESLVVDVLAFNAPLTGTAWHSLLQTYSAEQAQCEVKVAGMIGGIGLTGHIDRVRIVGDKIILDDHKHTNDYSFGYLRGKAGGPPGEMKPEHECQISLYAELYRQQNDVSPAYGVIWNHATAGGFEPRRVNFWTLIRCLDFKPFGGDYTVMDLLIQVRDGIAQGWKSLPLAGESMTFGTRDMCSYCAVRDVCFTEARGAPF